MKQFFTTLLLIALLGFSSANAQKKNDADKSGYGFKDVIRLPHTEVANQYRSGTCWSFSGISFLEAELMRIGKGKVNLSEMFVVNKCYVDKADKYVRMHGYLNFGSGGAFHDVTYVMKNYGMIPESAYSGLNYGTENHVHSEMDEILLKKVQAVKENKNHTITPVWKKTFQADVEAYLGKVPEKFTYKGKEYTPKSFVKDFMGLNVDDYVEITSYTHHPFYEPFMVEVPDNWLWDEAYNVKLDELVEIIDYSLENGYTVAWASDVSHKGFSYSNNGLAVIPEADIASMNNLELSKWTNLSEREKQALLYKFDKPGKEKNVTQEMRQKAFDNYNTTDDHGMHIVGKAKDKNGTPYYIVKNSWGKSGPYDGYFYASVPFIRLQTTDMMVNKNGIPKHIRKKLGI